MQCQSADCGCGAIFPVAHNGMPDAFHVYTYLVFAPGFQFNFEQ